MRLTNTLPALRFSPASLLELAFTNRLLDVANRLRELRLQPRAAPKIRYTRQAVNLRKRVPMIRAALMVGVIGLFVGAGAQLVAANGAWAATGKVLVAGLLLPGLMFLAALLAVALREIRISLEALDAELANVPDA